MTRPATYQVPATPAANDALSRAMQAGGAVMAESASALARALDRFDSCEDALALLLAASGRIVVTGLGKSGLIGAKLAATFASTGTPAFFVHAADALHGDAGMVIEGDVLLAISNSGETVEVVTFARMVKERGAKVVAMTGCHGCSSLCLASDAVIDAAVECEADPWDIVPTSSTTLTLVVGDALAVAMMVARGFGPEQFHVHHPGGSLGRKFDEHARPLERVDARRPELTTVATSEQAGVLAATRLLDQLAAVPVGSDFLFACPAGRTPITTYAALGRLAAERGADLSRLVIVMIDEYVVESADGFTACDPRAHYSCRRQVSEALLPLVNSHLPPGRRIDPQRILLPDPSDPGSFDARIDAAGGVDLFLLASGASDGHVAFNPPATPLDSGTRIVALATSTRQDNLTTFPDFVGIDDVPPFGVSVGLRMITQSRETVLLLLGQDKAAACARLLECTGFDPQWPASVIFECPAASIIVDADAAGPDAKMNPDHGRSSGS